MTGSPGLWGPPGPARAPATPPPDVVLGRTAFTWTNVAAMAVPCALLVALLVLLLVELLPDVGAVGGAGLGLTVLVVAIGVMLLAFGWSGIVRPLRAGVWSRGDHLVVRGGGRGSGTRRIPRAAVRDVTLAPQGAVRIRIHTADGRSVLAPVTTRWPHGVAARAQGVEHVRLLRAWAGLPL